MRREFATILEGREWITRGSKDIALVYETIQNIKQMRKHLSNEEWVQEHTENDNDELVPSYGKEVDTNEEDYGKKEHDLPIEELNMESDEETIHAFVCISSAVVALLSALTIHYYLIF